MKMGQISLAILSCLVIASCSPLPFAAGTPSNANPIEPAIVASATPPSTPLPGRSIPENETETNPSLPIPSISEPRALIETAKEDLAQRLSTAVTEISLVEINQVEWPDASLGCPQAGNVYAQAQTTGYQIKLTYAGDEFDYHGNIHGHVFYCESPTPPISSTPLEINP